MDGVLKDPKIADEAVDWLAKRAPEVAAAKPWFMTVNFVNPHDVMYFDTDAEEMVQVKAMFPIFGAPDTPLYHQKWQTTLPASFFDDLEGSRRQSAITSAYATCTMAGYRWIAGTCGTTTSTTISTAFSTWTGTSERCWMPWKQAVRRTTRSSFSPRITASRWRTSPAPEGQRGVPGIGQRAAGDPPIRATPARTGRTRSVPISIWCPRSWRLPACRRTNGGSATRS